MDATTRLSKKECSRLMDLVADLYAAEPPGEVQRHFLAGLQPVITYDLAAWHWMRPGKREIAVCYAPQPQRVPMPAMHGDFWRLTQAHPLNRMLFQHPLQAWKLSDVITRRAFHRTEFYNVLYRPLGVDCELTAVLPDASAPEAYFLISLHRRGLNFSERDRAVLNLVLPHIAKARRRFHAQPAPAAPDISWLTDEQKFAAFITGHTCWTLSPREAQVLFWICQGKTNEEIGLILGISARTAETHALHAYPKMGAENRYSAITAVHDLRGSAARELPIARDEARAWSVNVG